MAGMMEPWPYGPKGPATTIGRFLLEISAFLIPITSCKVLTKIVGKVGCHGTQICLWRILKGLSHVYSVFSDDWEPRLKRYAKAGATDEDIELMLHSILCRDPFFGYFGYSGENYIAFLACECLEVSVVGYWPLSYAVRKEREKGLGDENLQLTLQPTAKSTGISFSANSGFAINLRCISFLES